MRACLRAGRLASAATTRPQMIWSTLPIASNAAHGRYSSAPNAGRSGVQQPLAAPRWWRSQSRTRLGLPRAPATPHEDRQNQHRGRAERDAPSEGRNRYTPPATGIAPIEPAGVTDSAEEKPRSSRFWTCRPCSGSLWRPALGNQPFNRGGSSSPFARGVGAGAAGAARYESQI
jgi:hypothetical protein